MIYVMSGGGGGNAFAAIAVSYPAGSICTCTKGTKTLKAKDTSGSYLFMIPEAGTWTVTVTDGTETASQAVIISSQWQSVNVELSFKTYLYRSGNTFDELTGGWENVAKKSQSNSGVAAGKATITYNADSISVSNGAVSNIFYCKNQIDLTGLNTLTFKGVLTPKSTDTYFCKMIIWTAIGTYVVSNVAASVDNKTGYANGGMTLDVSQINGPHIVGFNFFQEGTATINEVFLE